MKYAQLIRISHKSIRNSSQANNQPLHTRYYRETSLECTRSTCEDDSFFGDLKGCLLLGKDNGPILSGDPQAELASEVHPFLQDLAAFSVDPEAELASEVHPFLQDSAAFMLDFLTGVAFLIGEPLLATLCGDFEIE